jgi:putative Ca2+/H+ antiporter (TMEM165/GDT1 family)
LLLVKVFLKMMKGKLISLANHIFMVSLVYLTYLKVVHAELEPKEDSPESKTVASVSSTYNGPGNLMGVENFGFIHALVASFSVILVSEIGDKTFFIAAIMAMRHPRMTVFAGAITALALMTILSALFGWLANVIPRAYTFYISTALFAIFGLKMLKEGCAMAPGEGQEELEEVQSDLRKKDEEYEKQSMLPDPESGAPRKSKSDSVFSLISRIFLQSFTLTFLAEWGDRSQLTTIILGAREV